MLKSIATKDLVDELKKRQGVNTYGVGACDRYQIITEKEGLAEDTGLTTIQREIGPVIILEVID